MNLRRLAALFVTLALLGSGAVFLWLRPGAVPIRLEQAIAVPVTGETGVLRVFLTIRNDGAADRLIGGHSPLAASVRLEAPGPAIPVPTGSAPGLAADGAHVVMEGLDPGLGEGAVLPLTLTFEQGGDVATRATLSDPLERGEAASVGLASLGGICRVGPGEPAPEVALAVMQDGDGWIVRIDSTDFTFSEPLAGMGHIPGIGHGHLYLDGVKLQRVYGPEVRIGALPPGPHLVSVTLNTNDHRAYVVDDVPVRAEASIGGS